MTLSMRKAFLLLVVTAVLGQDPGAPAGNRLDEANRNAAKRILKTMEREGSDITNRLRGLRKEDVIVVGGLFDFVQEILVAYRCPHTVIAPDELEHHKLEPFERKIFFLNCHLMDRDFPASQDKRARLSDAEADRRLRQVLKEAGLDGENAPGKAIRKRFKDVKFFAGSKYSVAGLKRLGAAVRKGSWLMSSDWAVLALERALPGTVRWTGHTTYEETVEVIPGMTGKRHSLMKGVFGKPAKARWWLETEAYLCAVKGKHKRLVESRQLAARYHGNKNIAVLLEPGKGRVLHALSHGWLQRGREDDIAVTQRLMLNFLTEKSVQNWRRERERKQKK